MCFPIILPVLSNTISLFRFSFCHKDIIVNVAAPICHWMKFAGQFVVIALCLFHVIQYVHFSIQFFLAFSKHQVRITSVFVCIIRAVKTWI